MLFFLNATSAKKKKNPLVQLVGLYFTLSLNHVKYIPLHPIPPTKLVGKHLLTPCVEKRRDLKWFALESPAGCLLGWCVNRQGTGGKRPEWRLLSWPIHTGHLEVSLTITYGHANKINKKCPNSVRFRTHNYPTVSKSSSSGISTISIGQQELWRNYCKVAFRKQI